MQLTSQILINILNVLPFTLQQSLDPLPCGLSKSPLKNAFLDIYLTIFFEAGISGKTSGMTVIFFGQMFKI